MRQLRVARGLSQTDVGKRIGISFQQLQKYELAANRISVSRLVQLAAALDVEPGDIVNATRRMVSEDQRLASGD